MECRHQPGPGFHKFRPRKPTAEQAYSRKIPEVTASSLPHNATKPQGSCPQRSTEELELSQGWLEALLPLTGESVERLPPPSRHIKYWECLSTSQQPTTLYGTAALPVSWCDCCLINTWSTWSCRWLGAGYDPSRTAPHRELSWRPFSSTSTSLTCQPPSQESMHSWRSSGHAFWWRLADNGRARTWQPLVNSSRLRS